MTKIYTVRLVRPVVKSVAIEVEAWSRSSAIRKAQLRATDLPDSDWTDQELDDDACAPHVGAIVDNQKIYETSANPHKELAEFRSGSGRSGSIRYLTLAADLKRGVGKVILQPWFTVVEQGLQADLCSDWVELLEFIIENDGLEEDEAGYLSGGMSHNFDNVIEFAPDDEDEEIVGSKS